MNYEAEVKKVYPDARYEWYIQDVVGLLFFICEDNSCDKPCISGASSTTEHAAWQSAYERLKQSGKL